MAQDFAISFYKSPAWLKNRKVYLHSLVDSSGHVLVASTSANGETVYVRKDGSDDTPVDPSTVVPPGMCERCFYLGKLTPARVVHHKKHITPENVGDPKVTLAYDNLMRLCQDCHAYVHGDTTNRVKFVDGEATNAEDSSLRALVDRLTTPTDERRNIHRNRERRRDAFGWEI